MSRAWLRKTGRAAPIVAATVLTLTGCSWLPDDPGPPVIENAPLPPSAEWHDTCIVGTWRLVSGRNNVDLGTSQIELTTTGNRVFTATADGKLTVEFPGDGLRWHGSNESMTVEGTVTGTAAGTYEAMLGSFTTEVDNTGTVTTVVINGEPNPPSSGGPADRNTQRFHCSDDELILSDDTTRFVYMRQ